MAWCIAGIASLQQSSASCLYYTPLSQHHCQGSNIVLWQFNKRTIKSLPWGRICSWWGTLWWLPFSKACLQAAGFPYLYILERAEYVEAHAQLWLCSKCCCTEVAGVKQLLVTSGASMENRNALFLPPCRGATREKTTLCHMMCPNAFVPAGICH